MKKMFIAAAVILLSLNAQAKPFGDLAESYAGMMRGAFAGQDMPNSSNERQLNFKSITCTPSDNGLKIAFDFRQNSKLNIELKKLDAQSFSVTRSNFIKKDNEFSQHALTSDGFDTIEQLNEAIAKKTLSAAQLKVLNADDAVLVETTQFKISNPNRKTVRVEVVDQPVLDPAAYGKYVGFGNNDQDGKIWASSVARSNQSISGDYGPTNLKTDITDVNISFDLLQQMFKGICDGTINY